MSPPVELNCVKNDVEEKKEQIEINKCGDAVFFFYDDIYQNLLGTVQRAHWFVTLSSRLLLLLFYSVILLFSLDEMFTCAL